jgi:hypothetical protein
MTHGTHLFMNKAFSFLSYFPIFLQNFILATLEGNIRVTEYNLGTI